MHLIIGGGVWREWGKTALLKPQINDKIGLKVRADDMCGLGLHLAGPYLPPELPAPASTTHHMPACCRCAWCWTPTHPQPHQDVSLILDPSLLLPPPPQPSISSSGLFWPLSISGIQPLPLPQPDHQWASSGVQLGIIPGHQPIQHSGTSVTPLSFFPSFRLSFLLLNVLSILKSIKRYVTAHRYSPQLGQILKFPTSCP